MTFSTPLFSKLFALVFILFIAGCTQASVDTKTENITTEPSEAKALIALDIYKNPNCGCCEKWIDHINDSGFQSSVYNRSNLTNFKESKGIAPRYRSCHTAVSNDGYIFEGHVPAKFVKQFLSEKPADAIGLSVPAMPVGTPGMEMGDKFMPYQVLLLKKDGSSEVYSMVNSYKEQF